ncbi:hypothetical protein FB45DRAFT_935110 [Roridomyces roridus]|uniref:F-box domain-containing protein n=1 Tax=Roridomyces roridus TaxID=1738132 RepID=A0AAD7BBS1_9AGAR|nr:hypothetical protein FB45DRAFT_935110 [Roridomyces roridus]
MAPKMNHSLILPPELLAEIFHLCDPELSDRNVDLYRAYPMHEFPWVLTHVCRLWRVAALSTPRLWRSLKVDLSVSRTGLLRMVSLFLERSSPCPIKLELSAARMILNALIFERLTATSERWEHLKIVGPIAILKALDPVQGQLPWLRSTFCQRISPSSASYHRPFC